MGMPLRLTARRKAENFDVIKSNKRHALQHQLSTITKASHNFPELNFPHLYNNIMITLTLKDSLGR